MIIFYVNYYEYISIKLWLKTNILHFLLKKTMFLPLKKIGLSENGSMHLKLMFLCTK